VATYRFAPEEFSDVTFRFATGQYQVSVRLHPAYADPDVLDRYGRLDPVLAWIEVEDPESGSRFLLNAQYDAMMNPPLFLNRDQGGIGASISGSGRTTLWTPAELRAAVTRCLDALSPQPALPPEPGPFSYDPALTPTVWVRVLPPARAEAAGSQTVPDQSYRTPVARQSLTPGEAVPFTMRWPARACLLRVDAALTGEPWGRFAVELWVGHGHQRSEVGRSRLELSGSFNDAGTAHVIAELSYFAGQATWEGRSVLTGAPALVAYGAHAVPGEDDTAFVERLRVELEHARGAAEREEQARKEEARRRQEAKERRQRGEPDPGLTLHEAARQADLATVRYLLERGSDPNAADPGGDTPLHLAVRSASFVWAVSPSQVPIIEALLDAGADPNARNRSGRSPLHSAMDGYHEAAGVDPDLIRLLLRRGADPDLRDNTGLRPDEAGERFQHFFGNFGEQDELERRRDLARRIASVFAEARKARKTG
jgi:hypothetical protein